MLASSLETSFASTSAIHLSPCSPAKRPRTMSMADRSPDRFNQLHFLEIAVSRLEAQRVQAERQEEEEEEVEIEDDMMEEGEVRESKSAITIVEQAEEDEAAVAEDSNLIKAVVKRIRLALTENGDLDLEKGEGQNLGELLDIFVEMGSLEKKVTPSSCRYSTKKHQASPIARSGTSFGQKAYYAHPHAHNGADSISASLATRAALGVLGASINQQFLPPSPTEMLTYQQRCMDNFMKRYEDFYQCVNSQQQQQPKQD